MDRFSQPAIAIGRQILIRPGHNRTFFVHPSVPLANPG